MPRIVEIAARQGRRLGGRESSSGRTSGTDGEGSARKKENPALRTMSGCVLRKPLFVLRCAVPCCYVRCCAVRLRSPLCPTRALVRFCLGPGVSASSTTKVLGANFGSFSASPDVIRPDATIS